MTERVTADAPRVVCICGVLAAGKTTLIRSLPERLGSAATLVFDDYEAYGEWPQDMRQWMAQGADPGQARVPRMKQDLESLIRGNSVHHPIDGRAMAPSDVILVEDPFGRTRPDIRDLYDLVLFLDLPWDLSVVRMVQRALASSEGDPAARIESAQRWLANYVARRTMYTTLAEPVRASADVVLDAQKPSDDVLEDALAEIRQKSTNSNPTTP